MTPPHPTDLLGVAGVLAVSLAFTAFGFRAQAGDCELNLTRGEGTGVQPAARSTGRTVPSLRGKTFPLRCQEGLCTVQLPWEEAPGEGVQEGRSPAGTSEPSSLWQGWQPRRSTLQLETQLRSGVGNKH